MPGRKRRKVGLGDWLMCSAQVKQRYAEERRPVLVVGKMDKIMWSEIFENNPKITKYRRWPYSKVVNGPGMRPYIASQDAIRWTWHRNRKQDPGEIFLTDGERAFAKPFAHRLLIEPNVKANGHANKAWPFERWQMLVREMGVPMIQCGGPTTRWLDGVERVQTPSFRMACAVLAVSNGFVGTEGALHHAAAALSIPAVTLWSEFISPDVTGYADQTNIRHAGEPCGMRVPCASCAASMSAITVEEVADAIGRQFQ